MGAWGHTNFENDAALDFIWDVQEKGVSAIVDAIKAVTADPELLDNSNGEDVLAAIEFIASAKGNASNDFPEEANEWLTNYQGQRINQCRPDRRKPAGYGQNDG